MNKEEQIAKYRKILPTQVSIRVGGSTEEGYWAKITSREGNLDNCYTQAETFIGLLPMITDAVQTHFDVPEEIRDEVGSYVPLSANHLRWEDALNKLATLEKQGEGELTLKDAQLVY